MLAVYVQLAVTVWIHILYDSSWLNQFIGCIQWILLQTDVATVANRDKHWAFQELFSSCLWCTVIWLQDITTNFKFEKEAEIAIKSKEMSSHAAWTS